MTHHHRVSVYVLPAPAKRMCVVWGLAEVNKGGQQVTYNWPAIRQHWQSWPNARLVDFCRHYDIPYHVIAHIRGFTVTAKQAAILARKAGKHMLREAWLDEMEVVRPGQIEEMAAKLSVTVAHLRQTAAIISAWTQAKASKRTVRGGLQPNLHAEPRDIAVISAVMANIAATLKTLVEVDPDDSTIKKIVPTPILKKEPPSAAQQTSQAKPAK